MTTAIKCIDVSKSYGKLKVIKNLNVELEENKIYGLLGRNGVGKTTLLNLICSQILRDRGEIQIYGEDVYENYKVLEEMCIVKEKGIELQDRRIAEIFNLSKILYKNWDEEYKNYLVKEFKLDTKKRYKNLSRGTKSIVGIILGLASRAKITIFDEPSLGLDAAFREKFYNLLLEDYENNKRTIILSTHLIDEVSNIFEEVIILDNGELLIKDNLNDLLEKAHFLSGKETMIIPLIKDKKIIHKESFGATSIFGVMGEFTEEELNNLKNNNIEISSIPLQKLFIYLTEQTEN